LIEVSDLVKVYRNNRENVRAVDGITFSVFQRDFVLVVGRSGSGKTTLLSMIGGLIHPTNGVVRLNNKNLWSLSDIELSQVRGKDIGFVFQFSGLLPALTALENVMLPSLFVKKRENVKRNAYELLRAVGLGSKTRSHPSALSGGEQKRVAVARALINDPFIILADEPTGDLDIETEAEIMELFRRINQQGKTILMVSHNPELSNYASGVIKMEKGKIGGLETIGSQ
jgi:putative ABC transport system ATP-binding protein